MAVTLQQFEYFCAVARNLSFSSAARDLYTSQPYVSNQIRRLEEHYGVPLFVRSSPRISLTEAGEALYAQIEGILGEVDQLELVVKQFHGLARGSIRVGATASAGNHVLPELIASFHRKFPDILVHARVGNTEDVVEWLELDEAEIGIGPQVPNTKNLTAEPFYRERLVVLHPSSMDLPDPLPAAMLAGLPKVAREEGSLTLAKMHDLLAEHPGGLDVVAELTGTTSVNEAVAAGLGVSLVPERSAEPWLSAGSVGKCTVEDTDLYHDFYLIYAQQRYITPATKAFIEHLRTTRAS